MYLFWNCFSIATYKIESIGLSGSGYSRLAGLAANIIPDQIFRSDPRQESFYKWQSMDLFENNTLSSLTIGHSTDQATHPGPLLLLLALEEHHNRGCLYLSLITEGVYIWASPQNGNILVWTQLSPDPCCHQTAAGDSSAAVCRHHLTTKYPGWWGRVTELGGEGGIARNFVSPSFVSSKVWRGHRGDTEDIWCQHHLWCPVAE